VGTANFEPVPNAPTLREIEHASEVIREAVHVTPMLHSRTFSTMTGANVYLKPENLQRAGSFKVRGATYKISQLSEEERRHGVIATSMGNHAQAVAIAAQSFGAPATIVMPEQVPLVKAVATQGYGARVVLYGTTFDDASAHARELQVATGATFVHAFDDPDIIAGQGTLGLEILSQVPSVDALIIPVGGGGLISGIAIAVRTLKPDITIIGVEAAGAASCRVSLDAGEIRTLPAITTIADGIALKRPGDLTFPIIRQLVDEVVTVEDEETMSAILLLQERCKLQVEGAGAVGLAALLRPGLLNLAGKEVVVLLSGGNIDMNLLGGFIVQGLVRQGRIAILRTLIADRPGELKQLLTLIADLNINVREMNYRPTLQSLPVQQVEVTLTLETRDHHHIEQLLAVLHEQSYAVREVQRPLTGAEAQGLAADGSFKMI
jgi:threonine dehydratase